MRGSAAHANAHAGQHQGVAVYRNEKGTTIAVSYSDCGWNLQSTYTQVILKMTQFLFFKYTSSYT